MLGDQSFALSSQLGKLELVAARIVQCNNLVGDCVECILTSITVTGRGCTDFRLANARANRAYSVSLVFGSK